MVIGTKELCRRVLRNQHKLRHYIRQQIRLCTTGLPRPQENFEETNAAPINKISCQFTVIKPHQVEHDPDVGQQFSASDLLVRLAAPTQLQPKPDIVDEIGFGKIFTDHMLKVQHHRCLGGWQKPEISPLENLVIHPAAKVLHYAVELFEGFKAYRGVDGKIRLFRPDMNMHRMNMTAKRSGLPSFEDQEFLKCICRLISIDQEWVPHTESASLYIRPTMIGIDPTLGVSASDSALLYTILSPVGPYFNTDKGIALLADPKYARAWPGGVGNRKMGSNYAPTIHIQKEASKKGLNQVLWLYGDDHQLTEIGVMNVFMLFVNDQGEKELITPPLNGLILPGITRDSVLQIAHQLGEFKVSEGIFTMPMICQLLKEGRLLELFGTGTAVVVNPVDSISYLGSVLQIPTREQEKPLYARIRDTLTGIQYGKIKHPWSVVID